MPLRARVWLHLAALAALAVSSAFFAWGAFSLAKDSWELGSTDLSTLRTPLALPQGLWAAGLALMLLAVVAIGARSLRGLAAGDADAVDRALMARSYVEEAEETLEAVAARRRAAPCRPAPGGAAPVIAIVFIVAIGLLIGGATLFGRCGRGGLGRRGALVALLAVLGAFVAFFAGGLHVGAALALLALLAGFGLSDRPFWNFIGEMIWGPSTNFVLVSVPLFLLMGEVMLRAGPLGAAVPRAQRLDGPAARRAAAHQHRRLRRVLRGRGLVGRDRRDDGLGRAAVLREEPLSAEAGARLARRRRRARQPDPAGHHFIIYGLITETSVGALYLAAIGPSLLVIALFTLVILYYSRKLGLRAGPVAAGEGGWHGGSRACRTWCPRRC